MSLECLARIAEITESLAAAMTTASGSAWAVLPGMEECYWRIIWAPSTGLGIRIEVVTVGTAERIAAEAAEWPKYLAAERPSSVTPTDVGHAGVSAVTVSLSRGYEVVAKEILKRLVPAYSEAYEQCARVADQRQAAADKVARNWKLVCGMIPNAVASRSRVGISGLNASDVAVERGGGSDELVRFTARLTPEQFALVLQALRPIEPEVRS